MAIKATVCGVKGHAITSVVTKETQIPSTAIFVKMYDVLCSQCGSSLEEIRKERAARSGSPRKSKPLQNAAENPIEVHQ